MSKPYNPQQTEAKWQKTWQESGVFRFDLESAKDPFYLLVMFPYPSGAQLHVGHWFQYSIPDSYGRFLKMQGKDVYHPMGFDAFGLPAENYAIKTGTPPALSTEKNVEKMIDQFNKMGVMFPWEHALNTSTPEYYRWTQWLFLQMFKHGLAEKRLGNVNWCPKDQTVLANEQVVNGACERCGTEVVQKPLSQWYWKITQYAEQLVSGLDQMDWPEKTKLMQKHWIGKKTGINITYRIEGSTEQIVCFTTRPDTNFGATFIVLAPEHPFVQRIANGEIQSPEQSHVAAYVKTALNKTELERQEEGTKKTGAFTGYYAINNLNGHKMPVWVSDFVLGGFGTGAVVGVPGHDLRDYDFAVTFGIPVIRVVVGSNGDTSEITRREQVQEEEGQMINSDFLDGMDIHLATEKMMDHLVAKGWGTRVTTYRLRDWLVSRQRYWGAPIPIVYDPQGNPHPIPEEHLPWLLPTDVEFLPTGESPLRQSREFLERTEKIFGKGWTPEYDTMDTFVCSSFYYLRFLMRGSQDTFVDSTLEQAFMPVDLYIGGPEHATMHLIYARFVMKALKDFGYVTHDEPFKKLLHQGLITNQGAKMSKSKGNVVSPDDYVEKYGADVFRMYLMFMGPFTDGGDWSDTGIRGIDRFIQRAWKMLTEKVTEGAESPKLTTALHATIKRVTQSIEAFQFNTAISALMEFLNTAEAQGTITQETARIFALLLSPLAPHLGEELWQTLGGEGFAVEQAWPVFDPSLLVSETLTIAVQVNGKLRATVEVPTSATRDQILELARTEENVKRHLTTAPKKEIYVTGKLVNFVV